MAERLVVSNTSPLLYLHQIGQLDLLRRLYRQIIVPSAVAQELARGSQLGIEAPDLGRYSWLQVQSTSEPLPPPAVADLGAGEAEVIAFGMASTNVLLILDDLLARRMATKLDLLCAGTIGVLVKAKQVGELESVLPNLQALRKTSIRVSLELIQWAMREAGEGDPPSD